MSVRYPVKWYSSEMAGAPNPNTMAGATIFDVLKKTLIEGFGLTAVSSMTYDADSKMVTATINGGHSFFLNSVIQIDGADDAAYNGEHRVIAATNSTFSFKPLTTPTSANATGETLTARMPPVGGWEILHEQLEGLETVGMIISSQNPASGQGALKITNSTTDSVVEVKLVYGAVGMNEHTDRSLLKYADDFADQPWTLVADDRLFYISREGVTWMFGDINSIIDGDTNNCILACYGINGRSSSSSSSSGSYVHYPLPEPDYPPGSVGASPWVQMAHCTTLAKNYTGGDAITQACIFFPFLNDGSLINFPNPTDGRIYVDMNPLAVNERLPGDHKNYGLRGYLPGMYPSRHRGDSAHNTHLHNLPGHSGKAFRLVSLKRVAPYNDNDHSSYYPVVAAAIDIMGPWR